MSGTSKHIPESQQANKERRGNPQRPPGLKESSNSLKGDEKKGNLGSAPSLSKLSSIEDDEDILESTDSKESRELRRTRLVLRVMEITANDGFSKQDMKLLAEGLALQYGLRTIPVGVSLNQPMTGNQKETVMEKPRKDRKAQELAAYKLNPKWIELNEERTGVVSNLKHYPKGTAGNEMGVSNLRRIERLMKEIKDSHTGKSAS